MKEMISYSPEFQRVLDLWHRANDLNDAKAQYELASCLLKSNQKNMLQKSFALFKKLSNQGYTTVQTDAQYMLGICYENGYGIGKSYQRAIRWYEKAAGNITNDLINNPDPEGDAFHETVENIVDGKSNIIEALDEYLFGEITPESMENMTEAAEYGNVEAQKYLMDVYYLGAGPIEEDKELSVYWAQRAAENGDTKTMYELGRKYFYGFDVEQDYQKALYWLNKAAYQGEDYAAYGMIGEYYKLQKQNKEAVKWYRKYVELKIKWRNNRLGWKTARGI
ncbi:MAG: sel1 repeat family protein [Oscillospiraceae bacterium]|nr:sel1 repeat family protein [Oscillospiraceae bacterium]